MNGEPRDAALDRASSTEARTARSQSIDPDPSSRPLPPVLNDEVVGKTASKTESTLAPLFASGAAAHFRASWDLVQRSFVDDPKRAVYAADELVEQVTRTLMDSFSHQRSELEKSFDQAQSPSTENLRIALRQYRAFFERLLSL